MVLHLDPLRERYPDTPVVCFTLADDQRLVLGEIADTDGNKANPTWTLDQVDRIHYALGRMLATGRPYPQIGSLIPDQPGYVVAACRHRLARSEWLAGMRTCERCPAEQGDALMIPIDLDRFLADVGAELERRARTGTVTVRFSHRTLTPHNIRAVRHDVPRAKVPEAGDRVTLPGAGYLGADAVWLVDEQVWEGAGTAVRLVCVDAPA